MYGEDVMNVCRNLAADVTAGRLSKDDLDDLMATLEAEKKRLQASEGLESVEAGMMEKGRVIAEDAMLALKDIFAKTYFKEFQP